MNLPCENIGITPQCITVRFLDFHRLRVSEQGFKSLTNRTRIIVKWFTDNELSLFDIDIKTALRFKKEIGERKNKNGNMISIGMVINYLKVAKKLFEYLYLSDYIKSNQFIEIKYPRMPQRISCNVLTESQMKKLLTELSRFDLLATRDARLRRYRIHVVVELLYATGLRIDEACSLHSKDINLEKRIVYFRHGKGGKSRVAFLTHYCADVLKYYQKRGKGNFRSGIQLVTKLFLVLKHQL